MIAAFTVVGVCIVLLLGFLLFVTARDREIKAERDHREALRRRAENELRLEVWEQEYRKTEEES